MFGMRVIFPHSGICPEKQALSVNLSSRCSACKINRLCAWFGGTLFGHCVSPPLHIVAIGIIGRICNSLFCLHLRLVTTFYTHPEHTPRRTDMQRVIGVALLVVGVV